MPTQKGEIIYYRKIIMFAGVMRSNQKGVEEVAREFQILKRVVKILRLFGYKFYDSQR